MCVVRWGGKSRLRKHNFGPAIERLQDELTETAAKTLAVDAAAKKTAAGLEEEAGQRARITAWIRDTLGPQLELVDTRIEAAVRRASDETLGAARKLVQDEAADAAVELRRARVELKKSAAEELAGAEARLRAAADAAAGAEGARVAALVAATAERWDSQRAAESRAVDEKLQHVRDMCAADVAKIGSVVAADAAAELAEERRLRESDAGSERAARVAAVEKLRVEVAMSVSSAVAAAVADLRKQTADDLADLQADFLRKLKELRTENAALRAEVQQLRSFADATAAAALGNKGAATTGGASAAAASATGASAAGGKGEAEAQEAEALGDWLAARGLARHVETLAAQGFLSYAALRLVTAADLDAMGITAPGHRKALLAAVEELRAKGGDVRAVAGAGTVDDLVRLRQEEAARRQREQDAAAAQQRAELEALAERARQAEAALEQERERARLEIEAARQRREQERQEAWRRLREEDEARDRDWRAHLEKEASDMDALRRRLDAEQAAKARAAADAQQAQRARAEQERQRSADSLRESIDREHRDLDAFIAERDAAAAASDAAAKKKEEEEERKAAAAAAAEAAARKQREEKEAEDKRRKEQEEKEAAEAAEAAKAAAAAKEEEEEERRRKAAEEEEIRRMEAEVAQQKAALEKKRREEEAAAARRAAEEEQKNARRRELERQKRELAEEERRLQQAAAKRKQEEEDERKKEEERRQREAAKKRAEAEAEEKRKKAAAAAAAAAAPAPAPKKKQWPPVPTSQSDDEDDEDDGAKPAPKPAAKPAPAPAPAPAKKADEDEEHKKPVAKKTGALSSSSSSAGTSASTLNTSDEALNAAVADVRSDANPTNWVVMGYAGTKNELHVYEAGAGGVEDFLGAMGAHADEVLYGYLRVLYGENSRPKFLLVTLVPESLSGMAKAKANMHKPAVEAFVQYFHTYFNITSVREITAAAIEEKLHSAGGAHYGRGEGGGVCGGGEDFGGIKAMATRNFEQKGAHVLSAGKSPSVASGATVTGVAAAAKSEPEKKKAAAPAPAPAPAKKQPQQQAAAAAPQPKPQAKKAPAKKAAAAAAPSSRGTPAASKKEAEEPKAVAAAPAPAKEEKKEEESEFMSEFQKRKKAVLARSGRKADEAKEAPKESLEVRLARAIQAITENGVEDEETGDTDVMFGDIKTVVDEDLAKQMRRMGQLDFVGSSLNDDTILTLKKL